MYLTTLYRYVILSACRVDDANIGEMDDISRVLHTCATDSGHSDTFPTEGHIQGMIEIV